MWVTFWSVAVQFKWKIKTENDDHRQSFLFFVKLATGVTFHLKPNIKNSNYNNYTPERMRHQRKTFAPGSDGKLQTNCSHSSAEDALITARACRQLQQKKTLEEKASPHSFPASADSPE